MSFAVTPVESLMRLTANAIADAVVPLVNVSVCTPLLPLISSVIELVMAAARNCRSAVLALVMTLTCTGMVLLGAEVRLGDVQRP